jgi:hypothetical protein
VKQKSRKYFYQPQAAFGVQEKESQRNFNNNQLENITNTNFLSVVADKPGQGEDNHQRQQEMKNAVMLFFSQVNKAAI